MPRTSKYTDEQWALALKLYVDPNAGPPEAARQSGIPKGTIAARVSRDGLVTIANEKLKAANETLELSREQKRLRLQEKILDKAYDMLERMDQPHKDFKVTKEGCADGAIGLAGECDPVGVAALGRVLPRLRTADGRTVVVDMAGVEYVDHRLLLTLDRYARGNGIAVSLRSAPPLAARLMELLPVLSLQLAKSGAQG